MLKMFATKHESHVLLLLLPFLWFPIHEPLLNKIYLDFIENQTDIIGKENKTRKHKVSLFYQQSDICMCGKFKSTHTHKTCKQVYLTLLF